MPHDPAVLGDLGVILGVAVAMALLFARLRIPPVLAYLAAGMVLGPPGLDWVDHRSLTSLGEVGVGLLLFMVGLEFSLVRMRRAWRAVLLAGLLEAAAAVGIALVVAQGLGTPWRQAVAWGLIASLSSTSVAFRLLHARGEAQTAHGRLATGVLVFQDLSVIPIILLLPVLGGRGDGLGAVGLAFAKAILLVAAVLLVARLVVPALMLAVSKTHSREVFFLTVLAVGCLTAFATSQTGVGLTLGAFLAGVTLADTRYAHQALADLLPLRVVMMCLFFVTIGMLVDVEIFAARPVQVTGLFLTIVLGKFVVLTAIGLLLGFPARVAAVAAAALAQVGEFSFVASGAALDAGLMTEEERRVFLAACVLTIAASPVAISLFPRLMAGPAQVPRLPVGTGVAALSGHVIVAGFGLGGRTVVESLERTGQRPVIVEVDPQIVARERAAGRLVVFGDVSRPAVLEHASVATACALVLLVSDPVASEKATEIARTLRKDLPIVLRTHLAAEAAAAIRPSMEVLSEEWAGALATASVVLRRCGVADWAQVVAKVAEEHGQIASAQDRLVPAEGGG